MFNEAANDQDFAKLTGGLNNVEYGTMYTAPKIQFKSTEFVNYIEEGSISSSQTGFETSQYVKSMPRITDQK